MRLFSRGLSTADAAATSHPCTIESEPSEDTVTPIANDELGQLLIPLSPERSPSPSPVPFKLDETPISTPIVNVTYTECMRGQVGIPYKNIAPITTEEDREIDGDTVTVSMLVNGRTEETEKLGIRLFD